MPDSAPGEESGSATPWQTTIMRTDRVNLTLQLMLIPSSPLFVQDCIVFKERTLNRYIKDSLTRYRHPVQRSRHTHIRSSSPVSTDTFVSPTLPLTVSLKRRSFLFSFLARPFLKIFTSERIYLGFASVRAVHRSFRPFDSSGSIDSTLHSFVGFFTVTSRSV